MQIKFIIGVNSNFVLSVIMIKNKADLIRFQKIDAERFGYRKPTFLDGILKNENYYIWHYIRELRFVEYHKAVGNKIRYAWHFIKFKRLSWKLHYTIYPGTIGPGLMIYHVGGFIHVGSNVRIGKNCTLLPGVVFGKKTEIQESPKVCVGDNCYFGLDSKIFGPLNIGNNVTVGANSVVTKDIPDNAVVAGVPAKIIRIKNK
mgnify:CR=1 FL=1